MGACTSSKKTSIKGDQELDFDYYLEEIRNEKESEHQDYEIRGKLLEIRKPPNNGRNIISKKIKYFFINPFTGKIRSKVKSNLNDIYIEGELDKHGKFKITSKTQVMSNIIEKIYEGDIVATEKSIDASGPVKFVENDQTVEKEGYEFLLDFTSDIWKGSYNYKKTLTEIHLFMKIREGKKIKTICGISKDLVGFSLWQGFINETNNVTIQQAYLGKDIKYRYISYEGEFKGESISGVIKSRDEDVDGMTQFTIKYEKNPKKPLKK